MYNFVFSMTDKESLKLFLKNLQEALTQHSINDISEALAAYLASKSDKSEETNYVLEIVCSEYKISQRTLIYSFNKGSLAEARNVAYCLLHYNLKLPVRHISTRIIPRKNHGSVFNAVKYFKSLNPEVKVDREFKTVYDKLSIKLAEFINEKNK
jgi:chromosomal replication initiation ATPase DnaA